MCRVRTLRACAIIRFAPTTLTSGSPASITTSTGKDIGMISKAKCRSTIRLELRCKFFKIY